MQTLLTVLCAVLAALCGGLLMVCNERARETLQNALRAEASEVRLKTLRGDVIALRSHLGALEQQLHRLTGRVYSQPRRARDDIAGALAESDDPRARRVGEVHASMGVGLAVQTAASCKCGWCETCLNGAIKEHA